MCGCYSQGCHAEKKDDTQLLLVTHLQLPELVHWQQQDDEIFYDAKSSAGEDDNIGRKTFAIYSLIPNRVNRPALEDDEHQKH